MLGAPWGDMEVVGGVCREPKFRGGGSVGAGVPAEGIWGAGDGVWVLGVKLCPKAAPRNQEQGQSWASWTPAPSLEPLYPQIAPKTSTACGQQRGIWLSIPAPHPHPFPPLFQPFTVPTRSALVCSSGILWRHFQHRSDAQRLRPLAGDHNQELFCYRHYQRLKAIT